LADTTTAAPSTDTAAPPPASTEQTPAWTGPEWLKDLPDEVKADKSLHKYTSLESATRGLINAQRMIGMDKVPRPRGDFDPTNSDWAAFLDAAGRPKTPDEYQFPEAKLPEGIPYDEGMEAKFKTVAHQMGLNGKQAAALRDMYVATMTESFEQSQLLFKQSRDEAEQALQKELGQAYEPTVNAAKVALNEYADPKFVKWLDDNGLGNHPEIVRIFGKIGKEVLGDTKLKTNNASDIKAPADWKVEADAYRVEHWGALSDKAHPDHKRHSDALWKMMQRAYPE